MRNVECGIVGTGETLEEVLSSEFSVLSSELLQPGWAGRVKKF